MNGKTMRAATFSRLNPARLFGSWRQPVRVVIWPAHRLIYIRVPKGGNTSFARAIPGGDKTRIAPRRLGGEYRHWTVFSFVRNPYARLVSTYCQKIHAEPVTGGNIVDGVHHRFLELGLPMRAGMSFEEFACVACDYDDEHTEKHLKSQSHHLYRHGQLLPGYVGRLENINQDWARLIGPLGLRHKLPHLNPSRRRHWSEFYRSDALRQRVAQRYRNDFEHFGYDPARCK
jgi:hypothetical protein